MSITTGRIRLGTSGWDFEEWVGLVYPRGRDVDRLQAVARFVAALEIDGQRAPLPGPVAMERIARWGHWAGLRFLVVAPRPILEEHGREAASAVARLRQSVGPLLEAGSLATVVIQMPQSLHWTREGARRVAEAAARLAPLPCAIEPRHETWNEPPVLDWARTHRIAWCNVDQPDLPGAMPPCEHVTARPALARLHGRDRDRWFVRLEGESERHAWRYDTEQLRPWGERLRRMAAGGHETIAIATNFGGAASIATVGKLRALLDGGAPVVPAPLADRDPELAALGARGLPLDPGDA